MYHKRKTTGALCLLLSAMLATTTLATEGRVHIQLPHFAGKKYVFYLMQGDNRDTIQSGVLDKKGEVLLSLPDRYMDFTGMSNFMLTDGGGLEILLNHEADFTIRCTEAQPTQDNIQYIGSPENDFFFKQFRRQTNLLQKARGVSEMSKLYSPQDSLYVPLASEWQSLCRKYADIQRETSFNPLYAGRIHEIINFSQGLCSSLTLSGDEIVAERRAFMASKVNFKDLWSSGLWGSVLDSWIQMEAGLSDGKLAADISSALAREKDETMKSLLQAKLTTLLYAYGKDNLLTEALGTEDPLSPGHIAPILKVNETRISPKHSLIIFYDSECHNCIDELERLKGIYPTLQGLGIRVISIAADFNEATYKNASDKFPWTDKYCDFKGFAGENFRSYEVKGTPTIYSIDKEGIISGRYARVSDFLTGSGF